MMTMQLSRLLTRRSFLAPLFCLAALDISLCPSSARWLPMAPCTLVFNPATPDPPLLLVRCNHVRSGSRHLRFALGMVNPRLEGRLKSRMTLHLFCTTECSPFLSSYCSFVLVGFLLTFFPCSIFSLICLHLFPFPEYAHMAPPGNMSPSYCELCDRTPVLGANLKEHRVGAIH